MNNIKTVEVISPLAGLEVGDTLTRKDGDSNFELKVETITEDYSATRYISLSQSLLNKDEFKAIEWFENKPLTNRQKIDQLEKELAATRLDACKFENGEFNANKRLSKYDDRINSKLEEFKNEHDKLNKELENGIYGSEREEQIREGMLVYFNLIDLLEKLKA